MTLLPEKKAQSFKLNRSHKTALSIKQLGVATGLLLLSIMLAGCINASQTNPDNPTTTPETSTTDTANTSFEPEARTIPAIGFKVLSSKASHACLIKNSNDGLSCWGANESSQLGAAHTIDSSTFGEPARDRDWIDISAGYDHTCGIEDRAVEDPSNPASDLHFQRLVCWGNNAVGQIGNGTTITQASQFDIQETFEWVYASAGNQHSCAIREEGTLWCWGDNSNSQLGNIITTEFTLPSQVGIDNDWYRVEASNQFTCGIKTIATENEGEIVCWGLNNNYQLGTGDTTTRVLATPISAINTPNTSWKQLTSGSEHSCALKSTNGAIYCWGDNTYGQIGDGSIAPSTVPKQINNSNTGAITSWKDVSAGQHHTCAIANSNDLYCWGNNDAGQLGINSTAHQATPVKIEHTTGWQDVESGGSHTCAVDETLDIYCWGLNVRGQLANGANIDTNQPTLYNNSPDWVYISSGRLHSCGLRGDPAEPSHKLYCGGINDYGQLGLGSTANQSQPIQVEAKDGSATISNWTNVSVGEDHTCAIGVNGSARPLFCWGKNNHGQLSNDVELDNITSHWSPTKVAVNTDNWTDVVAGPNNSCGLKGSGELWCWGDNSTGQRGNGTSGSATHFSPRQITGDWISVAVAGYAPEGGHICAIKANGELWCWGDNSLLQLGRGDTPGDTTLPAQIGSETDWQSIQAGEKHTCALKSNSQLFCWGDNSLGQIAAKDETPNTPYLIVPTNVLWVDFTVGNNHTCAISNAQRLLCWGDNSSQQLTTSAPANQSNVGVEISSSNDWIDITAGKTHTCGIRESATNGSRYIYCWGDNAMYQFGNNTVWKTVPQKLSIEE